MNIITKLGVLIGLFILVLFSLSCSQGNSQPGASAPSVSPTATPDLSQPTASKEATVTELVPQGQKTQRNEVNSVTIEATPQGKLMVGSKELVFNVVMDTHSVDLDVYDLTTLATLRDSQGRQFKAISWQSPKGGHHRSGTLGFKNDQSLLQPDTKYIELLIKDVAKVPERVLRWELRADG